VEHFRTLTGLTVEAARAKLDEELPGNAYKRIPGGADLTDINPGYMRKTLNDVFGICGVGWGYSYSPSDLHVSYDGNGQKAVSATLLHLVFWYKLTDGENVLTLEIPATGGSENRNASFAMKGALTNAIGNAASNVGFQESVYMDLRSHATVGRKPAQATSGAEGTSRPGGGRGGDLRQRNGGYDRGGHVGWCRRRLGPPDGNGKSGYDAVQPDKLLRRGRVGYRRRGRVWRPSFVRIYGRR